MCDNKKSKVLDRGIFGTGKKPSEELWLKMRAAFEANDVETMEELEKELLQQD